MVADTETKKSVSSNEAGTWVRNRTEMMTKSELQEIRDYNAAMALKFQSWGNAAQTLRVDIPRLCDEIERLHMLLDELVGV